MLNELSIHVFRDWIAGLTSVNGCSDGLSAGGASPDDRKNDCCESIFQTLILHVSITFVFSQIDLARVSSRQQRQQVAVGIVLHPALGIEDHRGFGARIVWLPGKLGRAWIDRKSTRLNSSH